MIEQLNYLPAVDLPQYFSVHKHKTQICFIRHNEKGRNTSKATVSKDNSKCTILNQVISRIDSVPKASD